jgi:hypothetical protein
MDIVGLSELLDDDLIINNESKWLFLSHLKTTFDQFKLERISRLYLNEEICLVCYAGKPIHFFQADERRGIGFKLDYQLEQLKDITVCNFSTGCMKPTEKHTWYKLHNYKPKKRNHFH